MKTWNRIGGLLIVSLLTITAAFGQTKTNDKELSVEESYLQESIEQMVIREQARADSRDMKLVALEYIGDAIKGGRVNQEIQKTLEYLAMEGTVNQAREGGVGRLVNNYPDVRAKAAQYLGELGTKEAKDVLVKMVLSDPEPMVLTEAVKSLGKIGINDNDEVTTAISWIVTRFDILNPDNILALSALEAYEKLAEKNGGIKDPSVVRTIIRIAEGNYIRPVQARARETLNTLRKYTAQQNSKTGGQK
ncbi:HEAT repeat domain-containing protein [Gracilinema caldarium]|uniref:HEAT repeat domain-containing protein n=1 Tax=Gracilinema caldarium TaxID=215591 RepID=UPI0026EB668F|nr:HEAT repeat domain-containing protein [Gracilinema caldarium]